ncbi:DUF3626 domain-containing protein [Mycolicibacterium baixiangningiae]|uniref:DUF3626 domain-containing protein n=1 Tax=Mycolicibacterium baixiangningiae TaxID=2761578 RepID=UPI0018681EA9|nr:DUF3626 domain-containing protein [Mycolicibacterium baixiangningiae]
MSIDIPPALQWISYLAGSKWPQGDEDGLWRIGEHWHASAEEMSDLIPDLNRVRNETMSVITGETASTAEREFAKLFDGDYSVDKLVEAMSALGETARQAGTQVEASKIEILVGLAIAAAEVLYAIAMAPWTFGASMAWIPVIEALTMVAIRLLFNQLMRALVRRAIEALTKTTVARLLREVAQQSAQEVAEELIVNLSIQQYQVDQGHKDEIDWDDAATAAKGAAAGGAAAGVFHGPAFGALGGKHGNGGIGNALAGAGASYGAEVVAGVVGALAVGGNLDAGEIFAGGALGGLAGGIQSSHGDGHDSPHGSPAGLDGGRSHAFDSDDKGPDGNGPDATNDLGGEDSGDAGPLGAPPPYEETDPNGSPPPYQQHESNGPSDVPGSSASGTANNSNTAATGAPQAQSHDGSSTPQGGNGQDSEPGSQQSSGGADGTQVGLQQSPGDGQANQAVSQHNAGNGQNGESGSQQSSGGAGDAQVGLQQSAGDGQANQAVLQHNAGNGQNGESGSQQSSGGADNAQVGSQQSPGDGQTNQAVPQDNTDNGHNNQLGTQQSSGGADNTQVGSQQTPGNGHDSSADAQQPAPDGNDPQSTPRQGSTEHASVQPNPQQVSGENGSNTAERQTSGAESDSSPAQHDSQPSQSSGRGPEPAPHQAATSGPTDSPPTQADTPQSVSQSPTGALPESPNSDQGSPTQSTPMPDHAPPAGQPTGNASLPQDDSRHVDGPPSGHPSDAGAAPSDTNGTASQPSPPSTAPNTSTSPSPSNASATSSPSTSPSTAATPPPAAPIAQTTGPTSTAGTQSSAQTGPSGTTAAPTTPNTPTATSSPSSTAAPSSNPAGATNLGPPAKSVSAGLGTSPNSAPTAVSNIASSTASTSASRSTAEEQSQVIVGMVPPPPPPPTRASKSAKPKVTSGGAPPKLSLPPRASNSNVSSDETWRHDPATTAEWFEPVNPTPRADIDSRRDETFVQTVGTDVPDTLSTSTPTSTESHTGLIRYDLRRIEVAPNKFVQEYTVKLSVSLGADPALGPDTVADIQRKAKAGVDRILNNGNRLPSGDEFRVNVQFTDTGAHAFVKVGNFKENSQTTWRPDASENVLAHEILHYLGVPDESQDARIALRRHTQDSGVHDGNGGIMESHVLGHNPQLRPRHLWIVERTANSQLSVPTSLLTSADNARGPLPPKEFDEESQPVETRRAAGFEGEIHGYAVTLPPDMGAADYDYVVRTPALKLVLDTHLHGAVLEVVTEPAAVVPGDEGRPTSQQIFAGVRDVMTRLREARPGATLGKIFDGGQYSVEPLAEDLRVRPIRGPRTENLYVHHSVGVPLAGLPNFMRDVLDATRTDSAAAKAARNHLQDALVVAQDIGEKWGWGSDPTPAGRAAAEGFVALAYTQFAALAQKVRSTNHMTKNFSAMGSRMSLPAVADGLDPGVREHLDRHGAAIAQHFAASFRDHFVDGNHGGSLLESRIPARWPYDTDTARSSRTIGDYLHSAFSKNPDRLVVGQDEALGIRTTLPELDANRDDSSSPRIDPPLVVVELRYMGPRSASLDDVSDTYASLVESARESFRVARGLLGRTVDDVAPQVQSGPGGDQRPTHAPPPVESPISSMARSVFAQGSKKLSGAQRAELDGLARDLVDQARQQLEAGRGGLRVRAEGGGNDGRFSRGADNVGRQRASATLNYLGTQVRAELAAQGMSPDAVNVSSEPTSRGTALDDELDGPDDEVRRTVKLTVEQRSPAPRGEIRAAPNPVPAAENSQAGPSDASTNQRDVAPGVVSGVESAGALSPQSVAAAGVSGNGFESRDIPGAGAAVRDSLPVSGQSRADVEGWIGDVNNDGDASVAPAGERLTNCGPTTWVVFDRLSGIPSFGRAHPVQLRAQDVGDATGLPLRRGDPDGIAEQLRGAGVGAHTVVVAQFDNGVAHSFNALFDGDQVWAIDGQHGMVTAWPPQLGRPHNPVTAWFAGTPDPHTGKPLGQTTVTGLDGKEAVSGDQPATDAGPSRVGGEGSVVDSGPVGSVVGTFVLRPFDSKSKTLNGAQKTQLDELADRVVEEARQQRDDGHDGLDVRAEGGGNGGVWSRGAGSVGRQRAAATLAYLDSRIQQRLEARGVDPDAVVVSGDPTSRGKAVPAELTGTTKDKRRTVVVNVQERDATDEVLSRLAAGDVVSLLHAGEVGHLESSLTEVGDRLAGLLPERDEHVGSDVADMVELLANSRITINFTIDESLEALLSDSGQHFYLNRWQRGAYPATEADHRDETEQMTGQYGGHEPEPGGESPEVAHARRRVNKYLSRESPNFRPAARPRYGALDYGRSLNGAAPGYGNSFLVLKEHVKHRATFTANDSMQGNPAGSTFLGMARLLARASDEDLLTIHHLATTGQGFERQKERSGAGAITDTNYLEAQLHTPIDFFRDVDAVSVDVDEMARFTRGRDRAMPELMNKLKDYAQTHNVRLELRDADGIRVRDLVATLAQHSSAVDSSAPEQGDSGKGKGPATDEHQQLLDEQEVYEELIDADRDYRNAEPDDRAAASDRLDAARAAARELNMDPDQLLAEFNDSESEPTPSAAGPSTGRGVVSGWPHLAEDDQDGDGWVEDADGVSHWGRYGAAGLLLRAYNSEGVPMVLLQRRAQWSDQGGTWSLPGGARNRDETVQQAALRETAEETGLQGNRFRVRTDFVSARAPGIDWTYSTVIADAPYPLRAASSDEGSHRWVPIDAVTHLPLHPALAESWATLSEQLAANPPAPPRPSPQIDPSVDPTDVRGGYAVDNAEDALYFRDDHDLLYREDTRPPEVIFDEGFAINPATRGMSKVFNFISTTRNPELSYLPPQPDERRFRYTIDAPGGVDVNKTAGRDPSWYQQEISFPGGIRRENIVSAVEILPPAEPASVAAARSPSSPPGYGPVVTNEHFNPDLPNDDAPRVIQGPHGGRPAPDDTDSPAASSSSEASANSPRQDETDTWDAYMAALDDAEPTPPAAGPSRWHTTTTHPDTDTTTAALPAENPAERTVAASAGSLTSEAGPEDAGTEADPPTLRGVVSGLPSGRGGGVGGMDGVDADEGFSAESGAAVRVSLPVSGQSRVDVEGWIGDINNDGDASVAPVGERLTNCGPTTWAVFDRLSGTPSFGRAHPVQLRAQDVGDATGLPLRSSDPDGIAEQLRGAGVGAHTVVVAQFGNGVAHSFNALFDGDEVWAIDGQHGTVTAWPPALGRPGNPVTGWFAGTPAAHSVEGAVPDSRGGDRLGGTIVTGLGSDQQHLPHTNDSGPEIAEIADTAETPSTAADIAANAPPVVTVTPSSAATVTTDVVSRDGLGGRGKGKGRVTAEQEAVRERQEVFEEVFEAASEYRRASPAEVAAASDRMDAARASARELGMDLDALLAELDGSHAEPTPPAAGPSTWHTTIGDVGARGLGGGAGEAQAGPSRGGGLGLPVAAFTGEVSVQHGDRQSAADAEPEVPGDIELTAVGREPLVVSSVGSRVAAVGERAPGGLASLDADQVPGFREVNPRISWSGLAARLPDDVLGCVAYVLSSMRTSEADVPALRALTVRQARVLHDKGIRSRGQFVDLLQQVQRRDMGTAVLHGMASSNGFNVAGAAINFGLFDVAFNAASAGWPSAADGVRGLLTGTALGGFASLVDVAAGASADKTFSDAYFTRPAEDLIPAPLFGANVPTTGQAAADMSIAAGLSLGLVRNGGLRVPLMLGLELSGQPTARALADSVADPVGGSILGGGGMRAVLNDRAVGAGRAGSQFFLARDDLGECIDYLHAPLTKQWYGGLQRAGAYAYNIGSTVQQAITDAVASRAGWVSHATLAPGLGGVFAIVTGMPPALAAAGWTPTQVNVTTQLTKFAALQGLYHLWGGAMGAVSAPRSPAATALVPGDHTPTAHLPRPTPPPPTPNPTDDDHRSDDGVDAQPELTSADTTTAALPAENPAERTVAASTGSSDTAGTPAVRAAVELSAEEFAAVVDAVVPPGRAVDAQDCGPLVRALVDQLYRGGVRPLGVSDDVASVRGGVGGAQDQVVAGGGWAQVNGAAGARQLAEGLPVGSTVVVMASPLRGEVGHVVAARVTAEGVRWADPQRPTERTGAHVPPEVASAPAVRAVVINSQGRVIDPQTWPGVQTTPGGPVSALLPTSVDSLTDKDLTSRFGAHHGHPSTTGRPGPSGHRAEESDSDVEMANAPDDVPSRPDDDGAAEIFELRVPGDGWCLLYSVVASTPPAQWSPAMHQGWAPSASDAHRQVRQQLISHQASNRDSSDVMPVSDASSPLSQAAEGLRQLVMEWVLNREPADLPSDALRPFRSSPTQMDRYEDWLASSNTDELRNQLARLGVHTVHSLDWMSAEDLRELTVQARAEEISENDPAVSISAARRQAESEVSLRSRRGSSQGTLAGPASQRDYLRRRGVGIPVDAIVDDEGLRSALRVQRQEQPLTPEEHQQLLDTIQAWRPSTSTWADDMGEMFPALTAHALGVRLRNRSTAGTHDVGLRNAPPVNIFHNGVDHWNAGIGVEHPGPTPTVLQASLPARPAPVTGHSKTTFPDAVKASDPTGLAESSMNPNLLGADSDDDSELSDPESLEEEGESDFSESESSDDGADSDDYRDSAARPSSGGPRGLPVARSMRAAAPSTSKRRPSPTDMDARGKRARRTGPDLERGGSDAARISLPSDTGKHTATPAATKGKEPAYVPKRAPAVRPAASSTPSDMTAATVEAMLRDQMAHPDVKGIQIARNYPGSLARTKRWLAGSAWGKGTRINLPKELSQMPDYEEHREAIAGLLRDLGLYDEPLPEPQAAPKPFSAANLVHALQSLIELRKTHEVVKGPQTKGKGKRRLLLTLADQTGYTGNKLTELLTTDGNWRQPRETLPRLPGYAEQREELGRLFSQLGHDALAQNMPHATTADRPVAAGASVSVAKVAAALARIAADPHITLLAVGTSVGMARATVTKYLAPDAGGLRIDPEWFTAQPDYAEHRDEIHASLVQMGQAAQADSLPLAFTVTHFLEVLRRDDEQIVGAIARMRLDPELSPRAAGSLVGMTADTLAAFILLVDRGPSIRDQAAVETQLRDTTPYLRRELTARLEGMTNLIQGRQPVDSRRPDMIRVTLPGAGHAPARMYIVHREAPAVVKPPKATQLALLYGRNGDLVRPPRSYREDRPRQALRWFATVLKDQLENKSEVQAYFGADEDTLYVSSNDTALNERLKTLLASASEFERILERRVATLDPRKDRHWDNLRDLMRSNVGDREATVNKIIAALKDGRVAVPAERYTRQYRNADGMARTTAVDLHAERRIMRMLKSEGRAMNLDLLAGTMRACGFCAADLQFEASRPRGPLWLSRNAAFELDVEAIIDDYLRQSIGTHVSRTRGGVITVDYNTDSESDAAGESTNAESDAVSASREDQPGPQEDPTRTFSDEETSSLSSAGESPESSWSPTRD